jgi:DNA polymerase-3 subunit beta
VGLHVAGGPDGLAGVSTDGYQLVHRILPGVPGWGGSITIPTPAVKIVGKLLADKSVERDVLRHSATLIAIEAPTVVFISRLIDGTFPDFRAFVPKQSDNVATVGRAGLLQALARIHAVGARTVRLSWTAASPALHLTNADTEDLVNAETIGDGTVALAVDRFSVLLDELAGKTINLNVTDATTPVRICDGDDAGFLAVLAPTSGSGS